MTSTATAERAPIITATLAGAAYAALVSKAIATVGMPREAIIPGMIRVGVEIGGPDLFAAVARSMTETATSILCTEDDAARIIGEIVEAGSIEPTWTAKHAAEDFARACYQEITKRNPLDLDTALYLVVAGIAGMAMVLRLGTHQDVADLVAAEIDRVAPVLAA